MYFINDIICTWSGRQNEREVYSPAQDREGMEFLPEFPPICKKKGVDGYLENCLLVTKTWLTSVAVTAPLV